MEPSIYKQQLVDSIPVVTALGVDIEDVGDDFVLLRAPLDKNINYEGTAFGGSLNTVAILSCYLLTHHILKCNQVPFQSLVIQNSQINYLRPVTGDFYARSQISDQKDIQRFLKMLWQKKMARIELTSNIFSLQGDPQHPLVQFTGRFVACL